jgi:hypothetical protein
MYIYYPQQSEFSGKMATTQTNPLRAAFERAAANKIPDNVKENVFLDFVLRAAKDSKEAISAIESDNKPSYSPHLGCLDRDIIHADPKGAVLTILRSSDTSALHWIVQDHRPPLHTQAALFRIRDLLTEEIKLLETKKEVK